MKDTSVFMKDDVERVGLLCPHCGVQSMMDAPTNQCVISLECPRCHKTIEKNDSGCCVFCSHGAAPSCAEACD